MEEHFHEHHEHTPQASKYEQALAKYVTEVNDSEVAAGVKKILDEKRKNNETDEVRRTLFSSLDLTTLKSTDNEESVLRLTEKVNRLEERMPDVKNVAAICVYPAFAKIVSESLEVEGVEGVEVACVAAGFPAAQTFSEIKIAEVAMACHEGATEIDIVMPVGKFLSGDYEGMCDEIEEIKAVCGEKKLKVILETGALNSGTEIKKAALLCMYSGADFIKTSTGKEYKGATPEAAYIICKAIREYHDETGIRIGIKVAGGIGSVSEAINYYTIVKEVLGKEWLNSGYFRIGTSRLADQLLNEIAGENH